MIGTPDSPTPSVPLRPSLRSQLTPGLARANVLQDALQLLRPVAGEHVVLAYTRQESYSVQEKVN
jgi:hypothetical protein